LSAEKNEVVATPQAMAQFSILTINECRTLVVDADLWKIPRKTV
jgi:hypothetical protein